MTTTLKYSLETEPTFDSKVQIPRPGKEAASVSFTFKHRGRIEYAAFIKAATAMDDQSILRAILEGWGFEEPFNDDNLHKLCQNFVGAPRAVMRAYHAELHGWPLEA